MKGLLLFLLSISLLCKAESLQTLTVLNLSSTNVAGLAWVDKHGGFHELGNGEGVLTNDGLGNISWVIPSGGGSGNFMSDGSVPMTGNLDFGTLSAINVGEVDFAAPGASITSIFSGSTTMYFTANEADFSGAINLNMNGIGGVGGIDFADFTSQTTAAVPQTPILSDIDYMGFNLYGAGDISINGSYWCQGVVGVSGISVLGDDALMHPVVGGIIQ